MSRVTFIHPDGRKQEVDATNGQSVMQTALAHLVPGIIGECGGELTCATCHVFVEDAWREVLSPMSADELDMLDVASEEPEPGSRLSCQIIVTDALDGLTVRIPKTQR